MSSLEEKIKTSVFIVAEIGKNFIRTEEERPVSEYLENAKEMARLAKEAGADAVKFQTHNVEDEVLNIDFDSPHFKGKSRYAWVSRNERATPLDAFWRPLKAYCGEQGIVFFSTPMSRGAAMKLEKVGVPFWKVASSDILDFPMLDFEARTGKPIMIPTGMSTLEDIDVCLDFLRRRGASFILMHAISRYPYPAEDSNLLTIRFFQKRYPGIAVGFSQNSPWCEPAIAAVALGARVVEQHFTADRGLWGPDHKVSMTPDEFRQMAAAIRQAEGSPEKQQEILSDPAMQKYMGREEKFLQEGEIPFRGLFRKSLVAARDLPAGAALAPEDIYAMRPQEIIGGLPSERYEAALGKKIIRPLKKYDPIPPDFLEK
ncbi:MAG: N-acetylneuraminate synthase family protein [Patescibacteria group bacterium]